MSRTNGWSLHNGIEQNGQTAVKPWVAPWGTIIRLQYLQAFSLAIWPHGLNAYGLKNTIDLLVVSSTLVSQ